MNLHKFHPISQNKIDKLDYVFSRISSWYQSDSVNIVHSNIYGKNRRILKDISTNENSKHFSEINDDNGLFYSMPKSNTDNLHSSSINLVHKSSMDKMKIYSSNKFETATYLKSYMALHNGQLYSCQFCSRKFRCRSTLSRHRKKMHKSEWEEYKLKKNRT